MTAGRPPTVAARLLRAIDANGNQYPSIFRLCAETGIAYNLTHETVWKLAERGVLIITRGKRNACMIRRAPTRKNRNL